MSAAWTAVIQAALDHAQRTDALVSALQGLQRPRFLAAFDARLLRQYAENFAPYRELLSAWTRADVLALEAVGLAPAVGRASLVRVAAPPGAFRVRWTWPQARFSDECLLQVCRLAPEAGHDPADMQILLSLTISRSNWEGGGGSRLLYIEPEWAGAYVAVWARIDLGFDTLLSHPLVLGQLDPRSRGWKMWIGQRREGNSNGDTAVPGDPEPKVEITDLHE